MSVKFSDDTQWVKGRVNFVFVSAVYNADVCVFKLVQSMFLEF